MTSRSPSRSKHADYYAADRSEFLSWIGGRYPVVLDIGCGSGESARWLRGRGTERLVGIEIDEASAQVAGRRFDEIRVGPVERELRYVVGPFDLVICADVLEHLIDPWTVVAELRSVTAPDGELAVSVPNIRYYRSLLRIAFGNGFRYESSGHFDSTHLRFYTRRDIEEMLQGAGWRPTKWGGPRSGRFGPLLRSLTGGRSDEWLRYQWFVMAVRA